MLTPFETLRDKIIAFLSLQGLSKMEYEVQQLRSTLRYRSSTRDLGSSTTIV